MHVSEYNVIIDYYCLKNVYLVIQNSGTHMENTILGSFTCTLLGFVIMNNPNNEMIARRYLRDGKFETMVVVLKQYYEFLNLTVSVSITHISFHFTFHD